ncbi:MAG: NADH-quinone oxidoreductase subunit C [Candidatus Asgardarchaeia archaeon]
MNVEETTRAENEIIEFMKFKYGDKVREAKIQRTGRVYIEIDSDVFKQAIHHLKEHWNAWHIITITGIDYGESFVLLYHFFIPNKNTIITMKTEIPKDPGEFPTITDLYPGANLYEREVYDMLGIKFIGHPNLKRLLLPEDWPEGVHPLRKDFTPNGGSESGRS